MRRIENILYKVNEQESFRANVYVYFVRSSNISRYYVVFIIQPILLVKAPVLSYFLTHH